MFLVATNGKKPRHLCSCTSRVCVWCGNWMSVGISYCLISACVYKKVATKTTLPNRTSRIEIGFEAMPMLTHEAAVFTRNALVEQSHFKTEHTHTHSHTYTHTRVYLRSENHKHRAIGGWYTAQTRIQIRMHITTGLACMRRDQADYNRTRFIIVCCSGECADSIHCADIHT